MRIKETITVRTCKLIDHYEEYLLLVEIDGVYAAGRYVDYTELGLRVIYGLIEAGAVTTEYYSVWPFDDDLFSSRLADVTLLRQEFLP